MRRAPRRLHARARVGWTGPRTSTHLIFVGDGPFRGELQALCTALVVPALFTGRLTERRLRVRFVRCGVPALPFIPFLAFPCFWSVLGFVFLVGLVSLVGFKGPFGGRESTFFGLRPSLFPPLPLSLKVPFFVRMRSAAQFRPSRRCKIGPRRPGCCFFFE
ncbi:hypothetical protein B0H12DRAFT_546435 [Mycena haematopus]|nr:hypothetical protein B0H12DRAFT_546435 [Mycena haematopus]